MTRDVLARKPESYRDSFVRAGEQALIPSDLAESLALSAGLRNVLVHAYEEIDYEIVASTVSRALDDIGRFIEIFVTRLQESA